MTDWIVDRNTSVGRFLREKKIQQWRLPILISCGGVKALHKGTEIALRDEKTRVEAGDTVRLIVPLPKKCTQALADEVKKNSRDFAFVPGTTSFDVKMGKLMEARPETIRIKEPLMDNLTSFILALPNSPLITNPIRNVIVASHANPEGHLFIALNMIAARSITYEDLEAAVKSKSLQIDDTLFLPRPTDNSGAIIPAQFLFRGCRIGSQHAYMKKLKEALGNKISVVAPKHFHIVGQFTNPQGYVEYMSYNFMITKAKQLTNKQSVVKAFVAAGFERIDQQPVPNKLWDQWIPNNPNSPGEHDYKNFVVEPINKQKIDAPRKFRYRKRQFLEQQGSIALLKDTGKDMDRKDAVKKEFINLDRYKDTHPFPEFIRYGYNSMDAFMDGWKWDFSYDNSSKTLYFNATRHEYTLLQPITEIMTNQLILNFYPTTKKGKVIELLKENDPRLFASF